MNPKVCGIMPELFRKMHMKTIVVKFGGSSLANADQIRKAARIIRSDPARRYVVVSAPGKRSDADTKVTDLLYRCYELAAAKKSFAPVLDQIRERFSEIVNDLGIDFALDREIEIICSHLESEPQRDYMASRGEYLNARIIAEYLGFPFIETAQTVRFFADGRLDDEQTDAALRSALAEVQYAVLPGFYGAAEDGSIRTFSRGGSDVTGSLVARAADADLYENWTDVSGLLFTDPRIVENPAVIDYITYRELRELSCMGASVLHEEAVFPVRKAGIPINIRNTNRPEDAGTMILPELPDTVEKRHVIGVAGRKGFTSILLEKSMMNNEIGFGAKFLQIFVEQNMPFEHCPTGIDTMSVVVNTKLFEAKKDIILKRIQEVLQPDYITVESDLAMIVAVGCGMDGAKGSAVRIFGSLTDNGVNIRMIDHGSCAMSVIIGVNEADFETAIRSIYNCYTH